MGHDQLAGRTDAGIRSTSLAIINQLRHETASWLVNVEGEMLDAAVTILSSGNDSPGEGPRLHIHLPNEILIMCIAHFFGDVAIIGAMSGNVVFGPDGVSHRFKNLGPGRLQTIDVHHGRK